MTLADKIRAILRAASGALTAREVRVELDDESATAANVGTALWNMANTGEVMRETSATSGSSAYLIDPDYKPKRASAPAPEIVTPPPTAKAVRTPARAVAAVSPAKTAKKQSMAIVKPAADAVPLSIQSAEIIVSIPRDPLRKLAAAVMAMHPQPMPGELKNAVLSAISAIL